MKIHRSNESFWNRCGMLLLLLVALLMAEAANAATTTTTTTGSETQTSATNGAIRQQQQQQKSAEEVLDNVQQQQQQQQLQHNESQTLAANSAEILSPSDVGKHFHLSDTHKFAYTHIAHTRSSTAPILAKLSQKMIFRPSGGEIGLVRKLQTSRNKSMPIIDQLTAGTKQQQ